MTKVLGSISTIFQQAQVLQQRGRLAEAQALYEKILAVEPRHFGALHFLGLIAAETNQAERAIELLEKSLRVQPRHAGAYNNYGQVLLGFERVDAALQCFDKAIALDARCVDAHFNRGVARFKLGQYRAALDSLDVTIGLRKDHEDAYLYRGSALKELGRLIDAVASFDRAIAIKPDFAAAYASRGIVLKTLGRMAEALASYERAIAIEPQLAECLANRGLLLTELGRWNEALESFDRAIRINTRYADAYANRGIVLQRLEQPEEALSSYDHAIAINPHHAEAHCNRGAVLEQLQRCDEALSSYTRALEIKPDFPLAYSNRGLLLHDHHRFDEALADFDSALASDPNLATAHENKAYTSLLLGNFERGLADYEWRWKNELRPRKARNFSRPLWLGAETLVGKTILLHAEQGLGDTVQFCRYAPLVAELGASVILEVQPPLVGLLAQLQGVSQVIAKGSPLPEFDFHCPLMSLPLAFGTTLARIPARVPYLSADRPRAERWRNHLGEAGFKVGIVWQGGPNPFFVGRSVPLEMFGRLGSIPGVRLISLQKDETVNRLAAASAEVRVELLGKDFDAGPHAFLDTVAVMAQLDLVITCDTATAHVAGALGRRTWIAVKRVPDWRWLLDRSDCPWYPSARLFRQSRRGDWDGVFDAMRIELARLAGSAIP